MTTEEKKQARSESKRNEHNRNLHATSAYLAEQARATERAMERKRWAR